MTSDYWVMPKFTTMIWHFPSLARYVRAVEITMETWENQEARHEPQSNAALRSLIREIELSGLPSISHRLFKIEMPLIINPQVDTDHVMLLLVIAQVYKV